MVWQVVTLTMIKLKRPTGCCHTDYDKVKAVLSDGDYDKVKAVLSDGCCHTDYDKVKAVLSDGVLILRQVVTLTMIKLKLSYQMVC